ncbi:MAG TPA: uroporphyrinogen decarboxylase family protein [Syntrophorhabdaceae bacterium]|nr:uroporphyrinogen decarboxylase family protein [Syntrophorhabdaceae bacterium]
MSMKSPEELYLEREKRVLDAIALKKPDRVPIMVMFGFFPARYLGMTVQDVMYDPEKLWKAQWKTMVEFQQDMEQNPFGLRFLGPILDTVDFKQLKWCGHGVGADYSYQFVEGEYMTADEYDHFLFDPTDFMLRKYWPRVFGSLTGLGKLTPMRNIITYSIGTPFGFAAYNAPEVIQALDNLKKAGEKSAQIASYSKKFSDEVRDAGFPMQTGGFAQAPFDTLGDYFRGTRGLMLDMYRRPDKVIKACEKLLPIMIEMAVTGARNSGNPRIFIPIHKGIDGFMSEEQFKKFFWPTLRELFVALIKEDLTPCPLWEGNCTSRLEWIKDIPAGKACYAFEASDIFKAKEVLGDVTCIRGNVPLSLMATGKPEDVKAYCKKLIDVVGKNGGYIMDASAALDDAKVENVKMLFEFTKEYGVY